MAFVFAGCHSGPLVSSAGKETEPSHLSVDALGNVYVFGTGNVLQKYSGRTLKYSQNIKLYGTITSLDVSNPLELYLFFKEAAQIVFLDNTLSYRGSMDISGKGMISCICRSFDNGIWLFDQVEMQLKKMDKQGTVMQTAGNMALSGTKQLNPFAMQDDGNFIYLADSLDGIFIYDLNANFVKRIPVSGISNFYAAEKKICYMVKGRVYRLDVATGTQQSLGYMHANAILSAGSGYYICPDSIICSEPYPSW
jgi:hypothetical protein